MTKLKIFMGYAAFAPYMALAAALMLGVTGDEFVFKATLFCLPMSFFFALISIYRCKKPHTAFVASELATYAHALLYIHLMLVALKGTWSDEYLPFTVMISLAISGFCLLLQWDNYDPED